MANEPNNQGQSSSSESVEIEAMTLLSWLGVCSLAMLEALAQLEAPASPMQEEFNGTV